MVRLSKHHILGLVLVFAVLFTGLLSLVGGLWTKAAIPVGDCGTIRLDAIEARARGDIATANYRGEEVNACEGVSLNKSEPSAAPSDQSSSRHWEFLANRPAAEKTGINSYGPLVGLLGNSLKDITDPAVALAEWQKARQTDPMQTAAAGAAFGLWDYAEVDGKTQAFSTDFGAWDDANATIDRKIDEAKAAGQVSIVALKGKYTASYAIPGVIPSVRVDMNVQRDGQLALRVNGHLFQEQCLFQEYWISAPPPGVKAMPTPSPGMFRNPEGTPVKLVDACRLIGGTWRIVHDVPAEGGDQPVSSPKCRPVTTPPPTTSTPLPSKASATPARTDASPTRGDTIPSTPDPTPTPKGTPLAPETGR